MIVWAYKINWFVQSIWVRAQKAVYDWVFQVHVTAAEIKLAICMLNAMYAVHEVHCFPISAPEIEITVQFIVIFLFI